MAGGRTGFFADHEEAGRVGGAVLDVALEQVEAVDFRGERTTECGGALLGLFLCDLGGLGGG